MRKTIITLVILGGLIFAAFYFIGVFSDERVAFRLQKDAEEIQQEDLSILVLGRVAEGQGGKWHLAPGLVDAIILFYFRPETNTVNLVSVPRDLYGTFADYPYKVNEIYYRGDVDDFLGKVPEITGISVENFLVVDLNIIEKVVDALGGIDVVLIDPVVDSVSGFRMEAGEHHLSGEDASWLIRNRNAPQGDFFREENQHLVIEALFDRFKSLTAPERTAFYFKMVPEARNIESNFSFGELIPQFGDLEDLKFNSIVLDFRTGLLGSSYIPIGGTVAEATGTLRQDSGQAPQASSGQAATPRSDSGQATTATTTGDSTSTTATTTLQDTSGQATEMYVLLPTSGIDDYSAIQKFVLDKIK